MPFGLLQIDLDNDEHNIATNNMNHLCGRVYMYVYMAYVREEPQQLIAVPLCCMIVRQSVRRQQACAPRV